MVLKLLPDWNETCFLQCLTALCTGQFAISSRLDLSLFIFKYVLFSIDLILSHLLLWLWFWLVFLCVCLVVQALVSNSFSYVWTVYMTYMASLEKAVSWFDQYSWGIKFRHDLDDSPFSNFLGWRNKWFSKRKLVNFLGRREREILF